MTHLFLNGLAASAGAGLTYIRNVVPHLSTRAGVQATVALSPRLRREFGAPPNVFFVELETQGAATRFWREQTLLPRLIKQSGADVLVSAGNFALRKSPVPQILLSGNSLYTSSDFYSDLRRRRDYRTWIDTRIKGVIARRSIHWADRIVAPSQTFAEELRDWTGCSVISIHHGFDHNAFFCNSEPLPDEIAQRLFVAEDALRLLFVSHYNYYRNFETLLNAIPLLRERLGSRRLKLFLTCKLSSAENPGAYRAEGALALVRRLGISDEVVELGAIPYRHLHHVYRSCDIYVTSAYAETFAHPLVEAMACGLPVVASDMPVHREICGQGAVYFRRFSPEELCAQVLRVASSPNLAEELSGCGQLRSREFSWSRHVDQIISLAADLCGSRERALSGV
jgi:glycosyltransferase involved in cell wall biosynthesis